jgi:DNA mismatch repair protein MutL
MEQKIHRLSEEVINRIAAGEVIESPASVVKELVENSLDAGAKAIRVVIEEGGHLLIRIEDDGEGMTREDALLSLERHATSKLKTAEDLFSLITMGFRGEALAAIAAVSILKMRTSIGDMGTSIDVEGGVITQVGPCARNRGTTIDICSLFFNLPARKKFLKSASSSVGAVTKVMETFALAHPEIGFYLESNGVELFQVFPETLGLRVEKIVGVMAHELSAGRIFGFIGNHQEAKAHRKNQYLFIHKRPIFSPLISKAVKMGYGALLEEHAHPSFVLFLDWPLGEVDINVHPQKKEVRFANDGAVFNAVRAAVQSLFEAPQFSTPLTFSPPETQNSFRFLEEPKPFIWEEVIQTPTFDFGASLGRPLALVDGYLLLQEVGIWIMDLKGAYARVLYEALQEKRGDLQSLLWPIEADIEEEFVIQELQNMGIPCRLIGKKKVAIDALPLFLEANDVPIFLEALEEGAKIDFAASRFAKEAKRKFHLEEAFHLWQELQKCREKSLCPLGKPILKQLDKAFLQKCFLG